MIMEKADIGPFDVEYSRWMIRTLQFVATIFEWVQVAIVSAYREFEEAETEEENEATASANDETAMKK